MNTTDNFVRKVAKTIEKYQMLSPDDHVIAGVFGGADSLCLLAVLRIFQRQCSFKMTVVHVEHGLRGQASLEDAAFVERMCGKWGIPCVIRRVDIRSEAALTGESLEEAGRRLRYGIFEDCCRQLGGTRLAVAHNQNDQAETVLLNLTRGSGVRGLGGILPVRGKIIRPLLFVSRNEIEIWMKAQQLSYCTDQTNLETEYTRNKIRLEILPVLEREINRETVRHVAAAAVHLQKAEDYLRGQAEKKFTECAKQTETAVRIWLPVFRMEEELMQEYILRLAVENLLDGRGLKDYTGTHFEAMKKLAGMPCGKQMNFPGGLLGIRQREELCLISGGKNCPVCDSKAAPETEKVQLTASGFYDLEGHSFCVEFMDRPENMLTFPEKKYTKWLAYDTIKHNVCLRTRRTGDYLIVNRAGGRKKLKDYMIDQKIPAEERDQVLLLAEGSHILWIVGWRISEAAKVTEKTSKIIKIQMMEDAI